MQNNNPNEEFRNWDSPAGGFLINSFDVAGPFFDKWITRQNVNRFVSDKFTTEHHNNLHTLFAGCSITVPIGIDSKDGWSKLVYEDISKDRVSSGYFNVSISGASILEIIFNVFKYIRKYGVPDNIILLLPNITRDAKYIVSNVKARSIIYNQYLALDTLCKINNVNLISILWSEKIDGATDWIENADTEKDWNLLNDFDSVYHVDQKRFKENIFDYALKHGAKTVIGDDGTHPGEALHYAWYKEIMSIYENHWN